MKEFLQLLDIILSSKRIVNLVSIVKRNGHVVPSRADGDNEAMNKTILHQTAGFLADF